jgi:HK97 gp10 family phage protein
VSLNGTVRIEGLAGLDKALRELGNAVTARRIGRKALEAGLEPIRAMASALAPDNPETSGNLKIAIGKTIHRAKTEDQLWGSVGIDKSVDPPRMVARKSGKGSYRDPGVAGNAVMQELGTGKMPANPFMRPAWFAEGPAAPGRIAAQLRIDIDKAARRAAKKG